MTRTRRFDFVSTLDSDPVYQWHTKCKLLSLAEVCALLIAVLFWEVFVCLLFMKSKIHKYIHLICLFVTCKIEDFLNIIGQSLLLFCVCLAVCLFGCQSPTGHNSKPTVMKLYQVVEVVSTEKPIDFAVKGRISKIVIFHPIDFKFEQDLHIASLNWETNYFWGQIVEGQLKVNLLKSSTFIWKIVNFHPIDLKMKQPLQSTLLNWETNYFWDQKVKGQLKVKLLKSSNFIWKIVNFHPIDLSFD